VSNWIYLPYTVNSHKWMQSSKHLPELSIYTRDINPGTNKTASNPQNIGNEPGKICS